MRACFTRGKGGHAIATLRKDELTKLLEYMGTSRRGLRGTAKVGEFVCGSFASYFVVGIIRSFLSLSF
jgi:hypothetical protein